MLEKTEVANAVIITFVPTVGAITANVSPYAAIAKTLGGFTIWSWLITVLVVGSAILLLRLIIRFFSFRFIKRNAKLIADDEIKFYQLDKNIIPFSFGNSIFINQQLHTEAELKEIIRHEFVHVKQHHTLDIIVAEVLCVLNWYNPFTWLIRKAIRQNLEFVADNKVLQNGTDKKEYQYLLLKVIGNNHFSVASNFNFSSLKKRITMMNKIRSAKLHLIKFLFVFPLIAIVLLSFRRSYPPGKAKPEIIIKELPGFIDTVPGQTIQNLKGFYIDIKDNKGNCTVVVKDKNKKEVKRLLLTDWDKMKSYFENLYGEIPSPVSTKLPANQKIVSIENDKEKPLIMVDGVQWPEALDMDIIDANKINSVSVYKNKEAIDRYGSKGKKGVISVETKKKVVGKPLVKITEKVEIDSPAKVVYYVNGSEMTKDAVDLIDPDKIQAVDVLKGNKAKEKYGEKGKNGVIEITVPISLKTNFIEKRSLPVLDIRHFLIGKKKDEC